MQRRHAGGGVALAFLAILLSATIVVRPDLAAAGLASLIAVGLVIAVLANRPFLAFPAAPFLVLLTWTKFRGRDPSQTLSGVVDLQVGFELGATAVLCAIAALAWKVARKDERMILRPISWLLLGYAGFAVVSTLWSPVRAITAVRSFQVFTLVVLVIGLVRVRGTEKMIRDLVSAMILYVVIFTVITLVVPSTAAIRIVHGGVTRYSWFAMHPGQIALLAGSAIVLLTAEGLFAGGFRRRLMFLPVWLSLGGMTALLIASRGRGQAIASVSAVIVMVSARFLPKWLIPTMVATLLASILLFVNLGPQLTDILASAALSNHPLIVFVMRGQTAQQFLTLSSRFDLWEIVFEMVAERPLLGHGYNSSRLILLEKVPWAAHAHNAWAQSLLDLGLFGTLMLGGALLTTLRPLFALARPTRVANYLCGVALGLGTFMILEAITSETFAAGHLLDLLVFLTGVAAAWSFDFGSPWTRVDQSTVRR